MVLVRFHGLRGSTLLSAAVYAHPQGRCLFVWWRSRVLSWVLPCGGAR